MLRGTGSMTLERTVAQRKLGRYSRESLRAGRQKVSAVNRSSVEFGDGNDASGGA